MKEGITWQEMLSLDDPKIPPTLIRRSSTMDSRSEPLVRPRIRLPTLGYDADSSRMSAPLPPIRERLLKYAYTSSSSKGSNEVPMYGTKAGVSHGFCMDSVAKLSSELSQCRRDYDRLNGEMQSLLESKERASEVAHAEVSEAWHEIVRLKQREAETRSDLNRAEVELAAVKATLAESLKLSESRAKSLMMLQDDQRPYNRGFVLPSLELCEEPILDVEGAEEEVVGAIDLEKASLDERRDTEAVQSVGAGAS